MAVLYGNDALSILVRLKMGTPVSLKKVFVFQKICFKVKLLKTFKIFTNCHIKACRSLKRRAIMKIPSTILKVFYSVKTKTNPDFAEKLAERSNHSFLLSI